MDRLAGLLDQLRAGLFGGLGDKLSQTLTTQVAYDGTHSLLITANGDCRYACAAGTDTISGPHAGSTVTMRIWHGGQGQGDVQPSSRTPATTSTGPQAPPPCPAPAGRR